jgi:hypothetical protein
MASEQMKKDMARLRRRMDGDDRFMGAHQIKKIRTREREIPEWTLDDAEVRKVLLRAFPGLRTSQKQAIRAGRWMRLIHLFYRVQLSNSQVAREMGESLNATKMTLKSIRRVARGQRADNSGPLKERNK